MIADQKVFVRLVAAASAVLAAFPDCANGPLRSNAVCNSSVDIPSRARALVNALTLEEKFNLTGSSSPAVERLGLPAYTWWNEALHGVAQSPGVNFSSDGNFSCATSFPQPILMGAAFDDDLIEQVASVVSTEARAFNNFGRAGLDFWTPNINPFRDSRWGRGQETPGEDPFHLQSYVRRLVLGLQGGQDPTIKKVVATCKHWVGYDIENWHGNDRYGFDAQIGSQDLSEYYTPSFQTCARDANVGSFMCSYNAVNGKPTCADAYVLQDILRDHWNWTSEMQYVTSDCDAVQNIYSPHHYSEDPAQAVADALNAGTDLNCGTYYPLHLPEAMSRGLINESTLDESLARLFAAQIKLGYFESASDVPYRNLSYSDVNTAASQALALRAAEEGIVLIKNNGILPIKRSPSSTKVALVGSWANATTQMQGNYAGVAPYLRSPYHAARQLGFDVTYAAGVGGQGDPTTDSWLSSLAAAKSCDIVIIADGIDTSVEAESKDRESIAWTAAQVDFIEYAARLGKPVVLLQMGGGQLDDSPFLSNPNISAIVWGGYPGQDGGTALFNILTGRAAPAGRLPVTQYPANYTRQVAMTDMGLRANASSGNPGRTYRWYEGSVVPFGYGLHYTTFNVSVGRPDGQPDGRKGPSATYDTASLVKACPEGGYLDLCPVSAFPVYVRNTGKVSSDYVAMGFLSGEHGPEPHPIRTLVAYQRVFDVPPGQGRTVHLNISLGSLARADQSGDKVLYPGNYTLGLDTDIRGQPLASVSWEIAGDPVTIEKWPQPR